MAHYAFLNEDGFVFNVIIGIDEDKLVQGVTDWESFYGKIQNSRCLRTSVNTLGGIHYTDGQPSEDQTKALRKNYAGIGFTYDEALDAFLPPKPDGDWVLDEETFSWVEVQDEAV